MSFSNAAGSNSAVGFQAILARALRAVQVPGAERATPITGTLRVPRLTIACRAGKIFLKARSPVAPKKTKVSE